MERLPPPWSVFSRRVPDDLSPNPLARCRCARGAVPYDLTLANPTRCGLDYPVDLLAGLGREEGRVYRPEPFGLPEARRAVATDYRRHGVEVDPRRVVLTASTSEAYGYLFKLLCDPGDGVATPNPSYPLLAQLARLEGVRAVPYALDAARDWQPGPLDDDLGAAPRAVVTVHPNNPTGSFVEDDSARALVARCRAWNAAWIVDEVFLDYPLTARDAPRSFAASDGVLTFALGGLSKSLGLPQLKLSWIVVGGPAPQAERALERLEYVADGYLSVGTPVQLALPGLLARAAPVREAIRERCLRNLDELLEQSRAVPAVSVLEPAGGWSAVVRYPSVLDEEALALTLLEQDGVAVHPGYLFDFPADGYLVLSLLPDPERFREGVRRLLRRVTPSPG